jgi:LacI family transcriptional regulator
VVARPKRSHRPTIHDVARRAEVSSTTVSHVLNRTRVVADDTTARVIAAVEALGYHTDAAARSLRSHQRHIVGLVITNPHNRGFASFMDGIDEILTPAGYSVIVSTTRGDPDREIASLRTMHEQRVDGLILASWTGGSEEYLHRLGENGLPMVQLNRTSSTVACDTLYLDYGAAGSLVARHLIELGHRHFGILGLNLETSGHVFLKGWFDVLAGVRLGQESTIGRSGVSREDVGYNLAREILGEAPRPTALVTINLPLALGTLLACQDLALAVPGDISLVTMGDAGWTRIAAPPVTAVADALPEWGRLAARFLLERIQGDYAGPPRREVFPPRLIVRGSTGPAPRHDLVATEPSDVHPRDAESAE